MPLISGVLLLAGVMALGGIDAWCGGLLLGTVVGHVSVRAARTPAAPTPAIHAILTQLKAGEAVHQAGKLPKTH